MTIKRIIEKCVNKTVLYNKYTLNINPNICKVCKSDSILYCKKSDNTICCGICECAVDSGCDCSNAKDYFGECKRYKEKR